MSNFQQTLGASWDWAAAGDSVEYKTDGWSEDGNPLYKWSQYAKPPVIPLPSSTTVEPSSSVNDQELKSTFSFPTEAVPRSPQEHSDNVRVCGVPFLGRLQLLKDLQGYIQSGVVVLYWIYGVWSISTLILLPHYREDHISQLWLYLYYTISILCITSFFRAVTTNPGRIPLVGTIDAPVCNTGCEEPEVTYCNRCGQNRPSSAHHCRRCGQCVRKMDHHCPWINNCVGEDNRFMFVLLVMYACMMSACALFISVLNYYYWPECQQCELKVGWSMKFRRDLLIISVILSCLMMMLGGGLFFTQLMLVRFDMATLDFYKFDSMIRAAGGSPGWHNRPKAKRSFLETYRDLCGNTPIICWLFPCRRRVAPLKSLVQTSDTTRLV